MEKILVTGAAGFIGFHLSKRLCSEGFEVVGVDNLNDYYDVNLKKARINELKPFEHFHFHKFDLKDKEKVDRLFKEEKFKYVVHLAAQAGVRYSLENPYAYIDSNIHAFMNILEACRHFPVDHLLYASSSSVYGANTKVPFSESDNVDHPISLYAATKKSNELMAHTYSALYKLPTTGLRFFTVYGPWGRPDMALFKFTKAILNDEPIDVYNNGEMKRDFTYIDDIIEGVYRLIPKIPDPDPEWWGDDPDPATSFAPYRIYNIGNNDPVELMDFVNAIEEATGKKAKINFKPMQKGDVKETWADVCRISKEGEYFPVNKIPKGIQTFITWYKELWHNESTISE